MKAGEIYLANFPFGGVPGMKLRPVLLLGTIPEVLSAYISLCFRRYRWHLMSSWIRTRQNMPVRD